MDHLKATLKKLYYIKTWKKSISKFHFPITLREIYVSNIKWKFLVKSYTVNNFTEIFSNFTFFQRYSRKYFRHRTGNSSYCLVGEIPSLLGKIDIFYNLSGKRFLKKWTNFRFGGIISAFHGKNFLQLERFVKFSHLFDIFPNSSEISTKIRSIFYEYIYI